VAHRDSGRVFYQFNHQRSANPADLTRKAARKPGLIYTGKKNMPHVGKSMTRKEARARSERLGRLKNPVPAEKIAEHPFPQMNASYPIQPRITRTGSPYTVVCLQQDDGRYVAEIAGLPTIRFVANTRRQALRVVTKMYLESDSRKAHHDPKEDRLWLQLARANGDEDGITVDQYRQRRGL